MFRIEQLPTPRIKVRGADHLITKSAHPGIMAVDDLVVFVACSPQIHVPDLVVALSHLDGTLQATDERIRAERALSDDDVVFERSKEHALAGIALPAGTAAELIVDPGDCSNARHQ